MIKFFRKIRQNLLSEGKTGKYFKYALGEIVLVVIGILIALSLNNWNESRKDRKSENAILKDLKNEFQSNLTKINEFISLDYEISKNCYAITKLIRSNQLESESHSFDSLLYNTMQFGAFDAIRGVVDDLLNSGKLKIITNDSLRLQLSAWTAAIEDAEEDGAFRFENYNSNLLPFLSKYIPLANGEQFKNIENIITGKSVPVYPEPSPLNVDFAKLNLLELENVIWHHKHNTDYVIRENAKLKKSVLLILNIVENELEKE